MSNVFTWITTFLFCAICVFSYKVESSGKPIQKDVEDKWISTDKLHTSKSTANFDWNYNGLLQTTNHKKSRKTVRETGKSFSTDIHMPTYNKNLLHLKERRDINSPTLQAKERKDECQNDLDCHKFLENSICLKDIAGNKCQCQPNHVIINHACIPMVNLGESCKWSSQCPKGSGCINDICKCTRDYIQEELECVKSSFGSCIATMECPKYGECINGSCICSARYVKRNYKCVKKDEDDCYNNNDCLVEMGNSICLSRDDGNVCECQPGYVIGILECVNKTTLGGSCEVREQCPLRSYCNWDKVKTCVCDVRYIRNGSECVSAKVGGYCETSLQCPFLSNCIFGFCTCGDRYINKNGKCVKSTVGDSCKKTTECPLWSSCDYGTCACDSSYKRKGSKCVEINVGDSCDDTKQCPLLSNCVNDFCICINGYGNKGGKCSKRYVGDSCISTKECPLWSFCESGACRCKDGYSKIGRQCEYEPSYLTTTTGWIWGIVSCAVAIFVTAIILLVLRRKRSRAARNGLVYSIPTAYPTVDVRYPVASGSTYDHQQTHTPPANNKMSSSTCQQIYPSIQN